MFLGVLRRQLKLHPNAVNFLENVPVCVQNTNHDVDSGVVHPWGRHTRTERTA